MDDRVFSVAPLTKTAIFACDSLQTMSRKNSDQNGANPMLYDPLEGGLGETSKVRQFLAATVGECQNTIPSYQVPI